MRVIHPKRDPEGNLFHYCPQKPDVRQNVDDVVGSDPCRTSCVLEQLPTRYRVHCSSPELDLWFYDIPKAHDTHGKLKGVDVCESTRHSWVEPKLDGVRAIVHCTADGVIITTRRRDKNGAYSQFQDKVPHLRDSAVLTDIGRRGYTVLDGEVVMPSEPGEASLAITMGVIGSSVPVAIAKQAKRKLALHLFDMPMFLGHNITDRPQVWRQVVLRQLLHENGLPHAFQTSPHEYIQIVPGVLTETALMRRRLYAEAIERGDEGIIAKDPDAGYFDSHAWLKVKQTWTVDAIVTGWDFGAVGGKYQETVGALRVSVIDSATGRLREICAVNPGDDAIRAKLYEELYKPGVVLPPGGITDHGIVVELQSQLLTKDGRLRHPRILRYRPDRSEPNTVDFTTLSVVE